MTVQLRSDIARVAGVGVGLCLVVLAVVLIAGGSSDDRYRVVGTFSHANHLLEGADVRAAGQNVGKVAEIELAGRERVRVELELDDDAVWPLTRGTQARLRVGGTVSLSSRYVELVPGPPDAPEIPDGGTIAISKAVAPFEFEDLYDTFDARTRNGLSQTLDRGGEALGRASGELRDALDVLPGGVADTSDLLEDLGRDRGALDTLVRSNDRVMDAVARSNPGVRELVEDAATTFAGVAARASALKRTLSEVEPTLATTRVTLARANGSLRRLDGFARRLQPGVRPVRELARPARNVLSRLVDVGPTAESTLRTIRRSGPALTDLLDRARPVMERLEPIGGQGAEQLKCLRPYAPEIAAAFSTWVSAGSQVDGEGHFARVQWRPTLWQPGDRRTPAELVRDEPHLKYAFPRPPGLNAGQPWFIPECGVGPESVDPAKDPEVKNK